MASTTSTILTTEKSPSLLLHAIDRLDSSTAIETEYSPGSDPTTLQPPSSPCSAHLSFGVEIECIFAFADSLIAKLLAQQGSNLIKDIPLEHEPLFRREAGDQRYRSWAVAPAPGDPSITRSSPSTASGQKYRGYADEPLLLVQHVLASTGFKPTIHGDDKSQPTYSSWSLHNDTSLSGLSKKSLITHFPDRVNLANSDHWDSWGVEIVSPPSLVDNLSATLSPTSTILNSLKGNSHALHAATVDEQCGLHVHIGHADNSPFALATLKQLLYMLILFEDVLTSLHPASRRELFAPAGTRRCFISSLRSHFLLDCERTFHPGADSPLSPEKAWASMYAPLAHVRQRLFAAASVAELLTAVQPDRFCVVNLLGHVTPGRPPTIEFRQHPGTLHTEDMAQWIRLCASLVHTAAHLGQQQHHHHAAHAPAPALLELASEWDAVSILSFAHLAHLLNLDGPARHYWTGRVASFGVFANPSLVFEEEVEEESYSDFDG